MQPNRLSCYVMKISGLAILVIAIAASISGCVTVNRYVEPTGTSIASIEFIDDSPRSISVHFHGGADECTDRTTAGFVQAKSQRNIVVSAGQNVVFTVAMDTSQFMPLGAIGAVVAAATYKACIPTIDFIPEVGRSYVFRINSDCTYQLFSKGSGGDVQPVAFSEREWIRPTTESGPFCKKK